MFWVWFFCLHGSLCGLSLYVLLICSIYINMSEMLACSSLLCVSHPYCILGWHLNVSSHVEPRQYPEIHRRWHAASGQYLPFGANSFKTFGLMLFGPAVLFGLSFCNSLSIPFSEIMSGAFGKDCPISSSYWQLSENADWNCLFRMVAWSVGLEWRIPFSCSGATPFLSVLQCFICPKFLHWAGWLIFLCRCHDRFNILPIDPPKFSLDLNFPAVWGSADIFFR